MDRRAGIVRGVDSPCGCSEASDVSSNSDTLLLIQSNPLSDMTGAGLSRISEV